MQPVFEPIAPVFESTFMLMERPIAKVADSFFKRIPLVEVEFVRIALDFRSYAFSRLFPISFDISFIYGTEYAFDDMIFSTNDLKWINYIFSILKRDKSSMFCF